MRTFMTHVLVHMHQKKKIARRCSEGYKIFYHINEKHETKQVLYTENLMSISFVS